MKHASSKRTATEKGATRRRLAACAAIIGALMGALVLSLAGCRGGAPDDSSAKSVASPAGPTAGRDAYDLSEMDFKTPPAVLPNAAVPHAAR